LPTDFTSPQTAVPVSIPQNEGVRACSGCGEDLAPQEVDHGVCVQKAAALRAIDHLYQAVDRLSFAGKESQAGWHVEAALGEICPAFEWRFLPVEDAA
jgi:hypothetical protein